MDPLVDTLLLLLTLSGCYLVLVLGCDLAERLLELVAARPRRARTQTGRTQCRTRAPRPRRRRDVIEERSRNHPAVIGALPW
jgi:hypothetical protein